MDKPTAKIPTARIDTDITKALKLQPVKGLYRIPNRVCKEQDVRKRCCALKKKGYEYTVSSVVEPENVIVTRIK